MSPALFYVSDRHSAQTTQNAIHPSISPKSKLKHPDLAPSAAQSNLSTYCTPFDLASIRLV